MIWHAVLIISTLLVSSYAVAKEGQDGLVQRLQEAETLYRQGEFLSAASVYQNMIEQEGLANGPIFFNLGNSFAKAGERGMAIAAYLKARQYLPRDADLRYNLEFLLQKNRDAAASGLAELRNLAALPIELAVTPREILYASSLLVCLGGFSFAIAWLRRRSLLQGLSVVLLLLPGMVGLAVASQQDSIWSDWAAVAAAKASVYSSPGEESGVVLFELHEGTPIRFIKADSSRVLIELSDQKRGWIDRSQLAHF